MAKWSDRLNQMTQNAISKSKEMAGVAKLNVDNTTLNLDIKNIQTEVGAYVLKNKLLQEDASIGEWMAKVEALKAKIEENNERIRELKNINVCTECGAEVPRASRFCEKCGAELTISASVVEVAEADEKAAAAEEVEADIAAAVEEAQADAAAVAEEVESAAEEEGREA